jgi:hypothetical protein
MEASGHAGQQQGSHAQHGEQVAGQREQQRLFQEPPGPERRAGRRRGGEC